MRNLNFKKFQCRFRCHHLMIFLCFLLSTRMYGQTNPAAVSVPYAQDFGSTYFNTLPSGFAAWNSNPSPCATNSASLSSTGASDQTVDSATVVQALGDVYGYSGYNSGVPNNDGELYIQSSSNNLSGTCQLVLAINTSGYMQVSVSYDIDMINPQARQIGVVFQYRIGTTGTWTRIDSSYIHSSSDRTQGQIDNFNFVLPPACENQPIVQLRWSTARFGTSGNSSGIGIDNILINATPNTATPLYFRSVATGNWSSAATWESSANNSTWSAATRYPTNFDYTITIRSSHTVSTNGITSLVIDQTVVDSGATLWNANGTALAITRGPSVVDLDINGTFVDSSRTSVVFSSTTANWRLGTNANFVKASSSSTRVWHLRYYTGIANIPATSNWYCRKYAQAPYDPSLSSTNNGPPNPQATYGNLYLENYTATWDMYTNPRFGGASNYPLIKGNFYVGGNGTGPVDFMNHNQNALPVQVKGDIIINSSCSIYNLGTGIAVQGNVINNGYLFYYSSKSKWVFNGTINQTISGSGAMVTSGFQVNKASGELIVNQPVFINDSLVLTNGKIVTASVAVTTPSTFVLNDNVVVSGASNTSFVAGSMAKFGDDNFTFPVGKGVDLQSIGILNVMPTSRTAFYTEGFNNACNSGCLATSYTGWTETATGTNGSSSNVWYISATESGKAPGLCQAAGGNPALHIGLASGDTRATYSDNGVNAITNKRIESPVISCLGKSNVIIDFSYIKGGSNYADNLWLVYFNGSSWSRISDLPQTASCSSPTSSTLWTRCRMTLPASAINNPTVKFGFEWANNGDGSGSSVSFAVDSITLTDQLDLFTAEYFHTDPCAIFNTAHVPTIDHVSRCEYWRLTRDNPLSTATKKIVLNFDQNSCGVTDLTTLRAARWNSATTGATSLRWLDEGSSLTTGSTTTGTLTSSITSGFGYFTLSSTNATNPLPITLLYFDAKYIEQWVDLNWATSSELNNDYFTVERSSDGKSFELLLQLPGSGTISGTTNYQSVDERPLPGVSYYRLKQTDYDGKFSYSDIIPVAAKGPKLECLTCNFDPGAGLLSMQLYIPVRDNFNLLVTDVSGRIILEKNFRLDGGFNNFETPFPSLSAGSYFLQLIGNSGKICRQFIR